MSDLARRVVLLLAPVTIVTTVTIVTLGAGVAHATLQDQEQPQTDPAPAIEWQVGPTKANIGTLAEITVPEHFRFTGADGTRLAMESIGNPTSDSEIGLLTPEEGDWFVVFEFDDSGHVKDDDRDKLDADAILTSIREGNEIGNQERRKRGWTTIDVVGWEVPPRYDPVTHNLEWAIRGRSEGHDVVNYNTRLLGREGVMKANLVLSPEELQATLPQFKELLNGYAFQPGKRYNEFKAGDKVAQYGLAALVAGGAAAVAIKTGWLAKFWKVGWKVIAAVLVAGGALFKKILPGRKPPMGSSGTPTG